jgi:uncharacterized protein YbjT (DUF2867 family)
MTAPYGTVLVVGATGETGRHVVQLLRQHGISVRAIARSEIKAEALYAAGVDVHIGDVMDELPWKNLMDGVQGMITTLGTRGSKDMAEVEIVEYIVLGRMVEAALLTDISQFVFTSSIGVEHPDSIPFLSQMLRIKRKAEMFLIRSRLPYTIVRPGGLVNDPPLNSVEVGRGDTLQGRITRADVAQVLVQALLQPEAMNQVVEIINREGAGSATRPGLFA